MEKLLVPLTAHFKHTQFERSIHFGTSTFESPLNVIHLILDGHRVYRLLGHEFYLQKGDFILIPAKESTEITALKNESSECLQITPSPNQTMWQKIMRPHDSVAPIDLFLTSHSFESGEPMVNTIRHFARQSPSQLTMALLNSMSKLSQQRRQKIESLGCTKTSTSNFLFLKLESSRSFMRTHFNEPLSLNSISRQAMLSKFHYVRSFKQAFGQSPYQFLTDVRLEESKNLLEHSEMTIKEISFASGFNCRRSFTKSFKAKFGHCPKEHFRSF